MALVVYSTPLRVYQMYSTASFNRYRLCYCLKSYIVKCMENRQKGFALPTILIASVIMMIVLLTVVASTVSVRSGLQSLQYNKLAQSAGEAGVVYAKACIEANNNVVTWSNSKPLRPNTDCNGNDIGGASAYVLEDGNIRTFFTVGLPLISPSNEPAKISSTGYVEILRTSTGTAWRSYEQTTVENIAEPYISDGLPIASSIEGYWTTAPDGYLLENGAAVSRTEYAALFAVIGTTFGVGDGSTTFNLPDSRGRVAVNKSSDAEFDTLGEKNGAKTHTLSATEMPSHTHTQDAHAHSVVYPGTRGGSQQIIASDYNGGGSLSAGAPVLATNMSAFANAAYAAATTATNQNTGGGGAHNNIQPSIVKNFAIKYIAGDSSASTASAGTSISGYWVSAPEGYLVEDGSAISRSTYSDLFNVIGVQHGAGNGSTTFNLPDSRGRTAVNKSADTEFDVLGEKNGAKTHTLSTAEMPSHTHTQNAHTHAIVMPGTLGGSQHIIASDFAGGGSLSAGVINSVGNMSAFGGPAYATATTATNQNTGGGGAHNNIQPSIVKLSVIKYSPSATSQAIAPTGTSTQGYWATAPNGYLLEDGSAVSRTTYASLFAVIGTLHGVGDGSTTFNLPDSRGRVAVNKSPDAEFDTLGEKNGAKTHTLSATEMPSHTHTQNAHTHTIAIDGTLGGSQKRIYGDYAGGGGLSSATPTLTGGMSAFASAAYAAATTATNQNTGGGGAHNNIQPSIVKNFAIKY